MGFSSSITSFLKKAFSDTLIFLKGFFEKNYDQKKSEAERKTRRYLGRFVEDLPLINEIEENVIYVVGENGYEWVVAFTCPCGCGELIQLNLLKNVKPRWRISRRSSVKISISPSIDRRIGCRSHFTVTNGKVVWWRDHNNSVWV